MALATMWSEKFETCLSEKTGTTVDRKTIERPFSFQILNFEFEVRNIVAERYFKKLGKCYVTCLMIIIYSKICS